VEFHTHKGYIQLGELLGKPYGTEIISNTGVSFHALKPLIQDHVLKTDRRTQVLYPKDLGYIVFKLGISSGSRIVEAGTGSGALTMALANAVKPEGRIFTYEVNERFQDVARGNIERAGLMPWVEMKLRDITQGIEEGNVDAIVLDMATPWMVVSHSWSKLKGSGMFLSFSPTIEQVIKTVNAVKEHPFIDIESIELLLRNIIVAPDRTRPMTRMLGHSGYITSARKVMKN
jgi:tRNA (adenine57-N1/adenine58-N1)-methyltransferase